jgi:hypothetical protein
MSSGITVSTSGDFSKTFKYLGSLESFKKQKLMSILKKYGEMGVDSLREYTPVDTGETASSWSYTITEDKNSATLTFVNDAQNDGIPIAILIQYGHGTGTGGYVPPNDFINPAMRPIFEKIANDAWKEVRAL